MRVEHFAIDETISLATSRPKDGLLPNVAPALPASSVTTIEIAVALLGASIYRCAVMALVIRTNTLELHLKPGHFSETKARLSHVCAALPFRSSDTAFACTTIGAATLIEWLGNKAGYGLRFREEGLGAHPALRITRRLS
jgi:hypothetical protein